MKYLWPKCYLGVFVLVALEFLLFVGKDRNYGVWAQPTLEEQGEKWILQLKDPSPEVRKKALEQIQEEGKSRVYSALNTLVGLLEDPDEELRFQVLKLLGGLKDPVLFNKFEELFRKESSKRIRAEIAKALISLGAFSEPLVGIFLEKLKDTNKDERLEAVESLGKLKSYIPEVVSTLIGTFKDKEDRIQTAAIEEVVRFAELYPQSILLLKGALKEKNFYVCLNTLKVIGTLGPKAWESAEEVAFLLSSEDETLSSTAVWALGELKEGASTAIPLLNKALEQQESSPKIRLNALKALVRLGKEPEDLAPLWRATLFHKDPGVRLNATRQVIELGKKAQKAVVPLLLEGIEDIDPFVQMNIITALGEIGDPKAIPALVRMTRSKNKFLGTAAESALEKMGYSPPQSISPWIFVLFFLILVVLIFIFWKKKREF